MIMIIINIIVTVTLSYVSDLYIVTGIGTKCSLISLSEIFNLIKLIYFLDYKYDLRLRSTRQSLRELAYSKSLGGPL